MKNSFVILILFLFILSAYADESYTRRYSGYPEGTFKKSITGKIVQYDNNGKKVGVYNLNSKRFVKTK